MGYGDIKRVEVFRFIEVFSYEVIVLVVCGCNYILVLIDIGLVFVFGENKMG